jgi:hypothetical protein
MKCSLLDTCDITWRANFLKLCNCYFRAYILLFLLKFMQECFFLTEEHFLCASHLGKWSTPRVCTKYCIAVNGVFRTAGCLVAPSLYLDDLAISCGCHSVLAVGHQLQLGVKHVSVWASNSDTFFSVVKTQSMYLTCVQGVDLIETYISLILHSALHHLSFAAPTLGSRLFCELHPQQILTDC